MITFRPHPRGDNDHERVKLELNTGLTFFVMGLFAASPKASVIVGGLSLIDEPVHFAPCPRS